jgi:Bacterial Ig-like domain (group 2)/Putative Ig domain
MKKLILILVLLSIPALAQCPLQPVNGIIVGLCSPSPDHFLITPTTTNIGIGQQVNFQATTVFTNNVLGPSNDSTILCAGNWLSSSTGVATVSSSGLVTGVSAGTSTISCTYPGSVCVGNNACTGSTVVTVLGAPNFSTPSQFCTQPCPLPNGLGPTSPVAYSFTFQGTGGIPPYTWSCPATCNLPAWAALNAGTGAVTGTPNAVATSTFTIKLCDTIPACNTMQVTLQVVANVTSFFPNSTTSQLALNKFAGTNSTIPAAYAGTASTTYSVTTNVATINVTNTFNSGEIVGISGCTSATFLNGTVMVTNGSTTTSAVVGPWQNTQGTALTHANVAATADTTCYLQGQGWQPFVTAPWPAPGSTNCTQGNPCTGQSGTLTTVDINTWTLDWATPSGALNSNPKNIMTMLTNIATLSTPCHPSKSGETYDNLISLDDGAGGYFIPCVQGGGINIAHAHIANSCGGSACVLMDTPTVACMQGVTGIATFSITQRPGANQALVYFLDISNNYQPTLKKETLTYSATSCSGGPGVTAGAATTVMNFSTGCPANGFQYLSVGTGLTSAMPLFVATSDGTHDTDWEVGLGTGLQNGTQKHQVFHIYNQGANCEIWDTQGYSGTALGSVAISPGAGGSGYHVGDVVNFQLLGASCTGTIPVNTVNGSGSVTSLGAPTMTINTGCVLGGTMSTTNGTGTGLVLIATQIGTPASPCCNTIWLSGSTTPSSTNIDTYGIHGGSMQNNGVYIGNSGWGTTPQSPCGPCDGVVWTTQSATLNGITTNRQAGHPAIGRLFRAGSTNPPYTKFPAGDTSCTPSTDCTILFTPLPVGSQNHSRWPTPLYDDSYPIYITSIGNVPKNFQPTNPPPWVGPFTLSTWAIEQSGTTHWFAHSYINSNNVLLNEDFNANQVIIICSQDAKFCIVPIDCNVNWTYNVGCGVIAGGSVPYYIESAVMTN